MTSARLGSSREHLALTMDSSGDYLSAELRSIGLHAVTRVWSHYASGFRDFVDFFRQLEQDRRGWNGERTWESLEGELRIVATHAHSHVELQITLRTSGFGPENSSWTATAGVTLDPGEQLTVAVRELAAITPRDD